MKATIAIAFYPLHWIHSLHDAVLAANASMVDICSCWSLISCHFLESICSISLCCSFWNKTRLGRHRSLNGWVAIRCIPASDLTNVIRRVATTSFLFEFRVVWNFSHIFMAFSALISTMLKKITFGNLRVIRLALWSPTIWSRVSTPFVELFYK